MSFSVKSLLLIIILVREALVICSDFAKRIGVTPVLLSQKISRGEFTSYVVTGKTKKIKFESGVREWISKGWTIKPENPDPELREIVEKIYNESEVETVGEEQISLDSKNANSLDGIAAVGVSRAKREHFDALIKETEYRKICGEYIKADDVKQELMKVIRNVKFQIQAIPGRIAPLLVGKEQRDIEKALEVEIQQALLDLSDDLASKVQSKVTEDAS